MIDNVSVKSLYVGILCCSRHSGTLLLQRRSAIYELAALILVIHALISILCVTPGTIDVPPNASSSMNQQPVRPSGFCALNERSRKLGQLSQHAPVSEQNR